MSINTDNEKDEIPTQTTFLHTTHVRPVDICKDTQRFELDGEAEAIDAYGTLCCFGCSWQTKLRLKHFGELPDWMKDNEFVVHGYRNKLSLKEAWKSIFRIHCETGNIWTHLVAAICTVGLCTTTVYSLNSHYDRFALMMFFLGCIAVFVCSFLFHTLFVCSPSIQKFLNALDYVGIVLGIFGSQLATILIFFPCGVDRTVFACTVSVLGVGCLLVVLLPALQSSRYRTIRTVLFSCFGLFGVVPLSSFVAKQYRNKVCFTSHASSLSPECSDAILSVGLEAIGVAASFLIGAAIYAGRVPERFWPGKFDILGHSHQVWHVAVILGFAFQYRMLQTALKNKELFAPECIE